MRNRENTELIPKVETRCFVPRSTRQTGIGIMVRPLLLLLCLGPPSPFRRPAKKCRDKKTAKGCVKKRVRRTSAKRRLRARRRIRVVGSARRRKSCKLTCGLCTPQPPVPPSPPPPSLYGPGCADPDIMWECTTQCHVAHRLVEPFHSQCKAKCPTHCPPPPPLASPSPPPPPSPDPLNGEEACEGRGYGKASCEEVGCCVYAECSIGEGESFNAVGPAQCAPVEFSSQVKTCP